MAQVPPDSAEWSYQIYERRAFKGKKGYITCSDIHRGTYELPNGGKKKGRTAWMIIMPDENGFRVGKGSEFDWDGYRWKVLRVRRTSIFGPYVHGNVYITTVE